MTKIAIIGAGMAGAAAANYFSKSCKVTVFDKARGAGGRMSSRRTDSGIYDHGAQYFTVRSPELQSVVDQGISSGICQQWDPVIAELDQGRLISEKRWSDPHYVATPGMNGLIKELLKNTELSLSDKVVDIERASSKWTIRLESGRQVSEFDWLICAIPAAQAIELLGDKSTLLRQTMTEVSIAPCLCAMVKTRARMGFSWQAARPQNSFIDWISVNSTKPGRSADENFVLHATEQWSLEHIDQDIHTSCMDITQEAARQMGIDEGQLILVSTHRWRYAKVNKAIGAPFIINEPQHLAACGDWCLGGRVEAAFLSGWKLAHSLGQ